jgi:hypothetical protein
MVSCRFSIKPIHWNMGLRHQRYSHEKNHGNQPLVGMGRLIGIKKNFPAPKAPLWEHNRNIIWFIWVYNSIYICVYIYMYYIYIICILYVYIIRYIDIENHCHSNGNTVGIYKPRFGMLAWCCLNSCVTHTFFMPSLTCFFMGFWGSKKIEAWFEKLLFLKPFFQPQKNNTKIV